MQKQTITQPAHKGRQCCCNCIHRGHDWPSMDKCTVTGDPMCKRSTMIPECVYCLPCPKYKTRKP